MLCLSFLILSSGCERTDLQKSSPNDTEQILPRSDCEACPDDEECCCGVELQYPTTTTAELSLCGTSDLLDNCSGDPPGDCEAFSNGGESFTLNAMNPRKGFCMIEGNAFWIANTNLFNTAYVKITCQGDEIYPQIIYVTIPPGYRYYYSTNDVCELELCSE